MLVRQGGERDGSLSEEVDAFGRGSVTEELDGYKAKGGMKCFSYWRMKDEIDSHLKNLKKSLRNER